MNDLVLSGYRLLRIEIKVYLPFLFKIDLMCGRHSCSIICREEKMKTIINENQRGLLFKNGQFIKMLKPGK